MLFPLMSSFDSTVKKKLHLCLLCSKIYLWVKNLSLFVLTQNYGVTVTKTPLYGYGCPKLNENICQGSGQKNVAYLYILVTLRNLTERQDWRVSFSPNAEFTALMLWLCVCCVSKSKRSQPTNRTTVLKICRLSG